MKREEIIQLAESAGITVIGEAVWRLCELVAAAEREACAKTAEDYADYQRSLGDEYAELRAMGALEVMDRIRARGEQE